MNREIKEGIFVRLLSGIHPKGVRKPGKSFPDSIQETV
jgi:hypothetical protein